MARTKNESGIDQNTVTDEETVSLPALSAATDERTRNSLAINQQFGLQVYNKDRAVAECALYLSNSAEAMLEAGKRLIQIKENELHGTFAEIINDFGLDMRTAQRMMQASMKYLSPKLASNASALSHLGKTKLFALMTQEDEVLSELAEGGSVNGLVLDDVQRMTTRELQDALRKLRTDAKETVDIKDKVINTKDQAINKLSEQVEKLKVDKKLEDFDTARFIPAGTEELEAIQKLTLHINAEIGGGLRHKIDALFNAFAGDYPPSAMRLAAAQSIGQMITTLHDVAGDYHIMPETEFVNAAKDPAQANAELMVNFETNGGRERLDAEVLAATQRREREAEEPPVYQQVDAWDDEVDAFDFDAPLDDE